MRRTILTLILVLWSTIALAQSSSPDSLYERGMDAITGIGPSQNDALGIDYFRRSSDLGYGPAQIALAYYYETGTSVAKDTGQAIDLYRKAAQLDCTRAQVHLGNGAVGRRGTQARRDG